MAHDIQRLSPLIGEWKVETSLGPAPARTTFEWALDGTFVLQRASIDIPGAPDALCIIAADGEGFRQHYFDSRGVVRLYAMTFDGRTWTLRREAPDFSDFGFAQRFSGELDGDTIRGEWLKTADGGPAADGVERVEGAWMHDFDLTYTRV
jgi:hypothetical protein